jgi:aldehyde:ferredoxin oxidoreductase
MALNSSGGYMDAVLRVDLTGKRVAKERLDEEIYKMYIGGVGLGIKILYDEVAPGTAWSDKGNRLIFAAGPLNGTSIPGSGTVCAVTKGCLTDGGASSQANGYFGAYLKTSGLDAIIVQGAATEWKYLHIFEGQAEIRDASHLIGMDTVETEKQIKKELGKKTAEISIYSIGPAGENLVKFAMLFGDRGHVLAHNGLGAVMGSKKLKAIAVDRGNFKTPVKNHQKLLALSKQISAQAKTHPVYGKIHKYGTSMLWPMLVQNGLLPVKNLTTNLFPNHEKFSREYYGNLYEMKRIGCWACPLHHVQHLKIKKGPHGSLETKDPEYECTASWSSLIGNEDFESAVMLSDLTDRLGMDSNEAGWTISFVIECFEKGLLTINDTDGLKMTWGNVGAVKEMLLKMARREGFGDVLAEGVKRTAENIGGEALNLGVYVKKGHSPRTHDARGRWGDILDYSTSGVGTSESNSVPLEEPFLPQNVARSVKKGKIREFVDSLVVCNIVTMTYMGVDVKDLVASLNLVTGWNYTEGDAIEMSERISNLFRVFNIRHGHSPDMEAPSAKYGSTPVDGPAKGKSIMAHWEEIKDAYYQLMGWDKLTGKPLPETLERLGLGHVISDIW